MQLVLPLRDRRSLRLEAEYAAETARQYVTHVYQYEDVASGTIPKRRRACTSSMTHGSVRSEEGDLRRGV